jgi:hypothetical protein
MKHLSLAFITVGFIGAALAYNTQHTQSEAVKAVVVAAEIVQKHTTVLDTIVVFKDTTIYRTKYVYLEPPHQSPDAPYADSSYYLLPALDERMGTKFQDTLKGISLLEFVQTPKNFTYQDSNIYLHGVLLATGVNIDSISVPAKLRLSPVWGSRRGNVIDVSVMSSNPYLNGLESFRFSK